MRQIIFSLLLTTVFFQSGLAADLYKVNLHSRSDADALRAMNVEPLVWVDGGYLVLADRTSAEQLDRSHLDALLLASDVSKGRLAFDGRPDDKNAARYRVLYEAEGIRLLLLEDAPSAAARAEESLLPIRNEHLTIEYRAPLPVDAGSRSTIAADEILDSLIAEINQDSLYNYVCSLQAYPYRVYGTDANRGAREWIYNKFVEFGYENAVQDPVPYIVECANVIAYKPGTVYPERIIIVGGHLDAVERSPGADDNGSGVAATLEIARALRNVELPVTIMYVAFDAEEGPGAGSGYLADSAVAEGWDIILMLNMDMIGAEGNTNFANAYYGPERAFALLWGELAYAYTGLTTEYMGSSGGSDHFSFQQSGFDVIFSQEYVFSGVYHTERDSTTHMNFVYMTRMVRGSLATVYAVSQLPRGVDLTELRQVGDGQSLRVSWQPTECIGLAEYRVCYVETYNPSAEIQSIAVPTDVTTWEISGLTEGVDYTVFVQAVDDQDQVSLPYYGSDHAVPQSTPEAPTGLLAMPLREAVILTWDGNNEELDFDHYDIVRDGGVAGETDDTTYIDSDPSLGMDYHAYQVMAVDIDGNPSDTLGIEPAISKAAELDLNRILAINRTSYYNVDFVSAYEVEVFLRDALDGYDYDFYSDTTASTDPYSLPQLDLVDMIDYGTLVIGAETGIYDDIGQSPDWNGILDTLAYYMSIGGRLVVFGRWGDLSDGATIDYATNPYHHDDAYRTFFHIDYRVITPTAIGVGYAIQADLVGAHSLAEGDYPDLEWDSTVTMLHSTAQVLPVTSVGGIPCESFVKLVEGAAMPIYAYDSRGDDPLSEGETVAWKYIGEEYSYAWFDIPLSHFKKPAAVMALRQAVNEVSSANTFVHEDPGPGELPQSFTLRQNYPNPFNPNTEIVYSLPRRGHVQLSVFNILGRRVKKLIDAVQPAGTHIINWDGTGDDGETLATGIYFYRMLSGDKSASKKMLLLK